MRRLAGRGFRRAAKAGRGTGRSVGCGVSRSEGSSRQRRREGTGQSVRRGAPRGGGSNRRRRRRKGRGRASQPGAAPRGAEVQAGGEGGRGAGAAFTGPARRVVPTKVGVGPPAPRPPGGLIPICPVHGGERAQAGAPCAPREHPDYIYQRVVSPEAPTTPSPVTQSGQGEPSPQGKSDIPPHAAPARVPAPCLAAFRAARTPEHRPDRGDSDPWRADPGRDARPGITGVLPRCAVHPTPPSPCVFTQVKEVQWFQGRPAPAPGRRGNGDPAPCPTTAAPPRPTAPDRPAGPLPRHRRPPEPSPREAPHPGDRLRPAPTGAVAAGLNRHPVGRRAGPTSRSPSPPSLPA